MKQESFVITRELSRHAPAARKREMPESIETQDGNTYRLTETLGCGGLGIIYKAVRDSDNLTVAIKLARTEDDSYSQNALRREGKILSSLKHPNIVKMLERGETAAGQPYLVLEYLHGRTLEDLLSKDGPLDLAEAMRVSVEVAAALHHAHSAGIVHCDVKPANVFIDEAGNVKIFDFGISSPTTDSVRSHRYGSLLYMSPEQILDKPCNVSSDIYQLALVFYRSYFDRLPFNCSSFDDIVHYRLEHSSISWSGRETSGALRTLLETALSPNKVERPNDMQKFIERLRVAANGRSEYAEARDACE
jgi:serine/threonine protein kinase